MLELLDHRQYRFSKVNMKWSIIAAAAVVPLASASGFTREEYASGEVMEIMMEAKEVRFFPTVNTYDAIVDKDSGGMGQASRGW